MRVAKNELRQRMRALRARLSEDEVVRGSEAAAARLLALPEVTAARCVALFAPIIDSNEIQTAAIHAGLVARGVRVSYPTVRAPTEPLAFHEIADPGDLVVSRLGIPQPPADATPIALEAIDVFVMPGLAFDALGERLGWGRGHYDRTIARAPAALRVGFAYELQVVPRVPVGADDERVDRVITESATRTAPPRRTS
jgi:5-formyltetrahydrofolate cyclo-ligase